MTSPYPARRRRAIQLLGTALHAEEVLGFLIGLMELQAAVFDRAVERGLVDQVRRTGATALPHVALPHVAVPNFDPPHFDLSRLEVAPLAPAMRKLVVGAASIATEVLAKAALALADQSDERLSGVLEAFVRGGDLTDSVTATGIDEAPLTFFARAFLQPVTETLRWEDAASDASGHPAGLRHTCPGCGHPPLLSIFRDEEHKKNARTLCCSLCAEEWPFPRLTCPLCGESESKALLHHASDALPHIRVDECRSCQSYLKGIDLREAGDAVPIVDEIAAVELDLWARQRGLRKAQPNLLGL